MADDFLRFGVQFADGRKATNLDRPFHDPEQEPDRPMLSQHGGGGGGAAWDLEHWTWPLPPDGPFAFVRAWPARGIAESRAEIDAGMVLEAAGRAETLWPDDQPGVPVRAGSASLPPVSNYWSALVSRS